MDKENGLPPYSVLMSVYYNDVPEWFEEAFQSMIEQSWPPKEIVLVEDGLVPQKLQESIDCCVKQYPDVVRLIPLPENKGLAEAMRIGVPACSCEWIARMDADDISDTARCEEELRLAVDNGADMVSCNYEEFLGTKDQVIARRVYPTDHEELVRLSRRRSPLCHAAVMMKKSMVIAAGNFRGDYKVEDYDLFVRMLMNGAKCCTVNQFLYHIRANENYFQRRGGWKYVKSAIQFNAWMLKQRWTSPSDFFVRSAGMALVGLAPGSVRAWFYKTALRR